MKMDTSISRLYPKSIDFAGNHQKWRGTSSFCCKGNVYISAGYKFGLLTSTYIVAYSLLFSVFVALRLEISRWLLITLEIIFSSLTLILCLVCIFSDPGVLPAQLYTPSQLKNVFVTDHHRTMFIKGTKLKIKFCKTCHIVRPPGVFHCKKCGGCIDRFDHHCPWVGNCIGKNNYKYFFSFLISFNILLYYNLFVSMYYLIYRKSMTEANNKVLDKEYMALVVILLSIITCGFVTTLLIYHIYFSTRNMTTYANIKMSETFMMFGNPFSRKNWKKNCHEVFCRKYYKKTKFQEQNALPIIPLNNIKISKNLLKSKEFNFNTDKFVIVPIEVKKRSIEKSEEDDRMECDTRKIENNNNMNDLLNGESHKTIRVNAKMKGKSLYTLETEETSTKEKKLKKSKLRVYQKECK